MRQEVISSLSLLYVLIIAFLLTTIPIVIDKAARLDYLSLLCGHISYSELYFLELRALDDKCAYTGEIAVEHVANARNEDPVANLENVGPL